MKQFFFSLLLIPSLLLGLSACSFGGGSNAPSTPTPVAATTAAPTPTATSTPTPTPTPPIQPTSSADISALTQMVTLYYDALKAQNYQQAYTYLDPNATDANGQHITLSSFEAMAQMMEGTGGSIASFTMDVIPPQVVMTVTRQYVYHAHLQVKKEGQTWKITSLDRT